MDEYKYMSPGRPLHCDNLLAPLYVCRYVHMYTYIVVRIVITYRGKSDH